MCSAVIRLSFALLSVNHSERAVGDDRQLAIKVYCTPMEICDHIAALRREGDVLATVAAV